MTEQRKRKALKALQRMKKRMTYREMGDEIGVEPVTAYKYCAERLRLSGPLVRCIELLGWV